MLGAVQATLIATSKIAITPPVMAFEFSETSGTTASDTGTGGTGRTASLSTGLQFAADGARRVLDCTNATHTGALISGSDVLAPSNAAFSIESCLFLDSFSDAAPTIIKLKTGATNDPYVIFLSRSVGYYGVSIGSATAFARLRSGSAVADGDYFLGTTYRHVVMTYNGGGAGTAGNFKVYIGASSKSLTSASGFGATTDESRIASYSTTSSQITGNIDFVRVYNYELSQIQINELFLLSGATA